MAEDGSVVTIDLGGRFVRGREMRLLDYAVH